MMGGRADVVMSDMAANTTGHRKTDQLRISAWSKRRRRLRRTCSIPAERSSQKSFRAAPTPNWSRN